MGIDLIPVKEFSEDPTTQTYKLGTVTITKGEMANSQKINEIILELRDLQQQVTRLSLR